MATKKGETYLRPSEIRYSQISILNKFKNGSKIGDLLDDMYFGRCFASSIDRIEVAKVDGLWYSADNRRLWVFKHLEMLARLDTILVKVKKKIFQGKLTTKNKGTSVKIRGGDPGGSVYTEHRELIETQENTALDNKENETPKKRKQRRRKKKAKNENGLKETNVTDSMKTERQQSAETKLEHVYSKENHLPSEGSDDESDRCGESDLETDGYIAGYIEPDEDWYLENEYSEDEDPETDDSEELSQESDNYSGENTESSGTDDEFQNTDTVQQHATADQQVTTDKHSKLLDSESHQANMACTINKLDDIIKALQIQNIEMLNQVIGDIAQNYGYIRSKVPSGINVKNQKTFGDHVRSKTAPSERISSPTASCNANTSYVTVGELHRRQSRTSEPFTSHSAFCEHNRRQVASNEPMTSRAALGERIKRQVPYSEPRTSQVAFDEGVRGKVLYSRPRTSHIVFDEQMPFNEGSASHVTFDERMRRQMAHNESTSRMPVDERAAIKQTSHGEHLTNADERSWTPTLARQTLWNNHGKRHRTSIENNTLSKTSRESRSMWGSLNDELDNYSGNTTFSYGNNHRYYPRARGLDNNESISTVYKDTPETSRRKTIERDNVFKPDPSARLARPNSEESFLGKVFDKVLDFFWPSSK